MPKYVFVTGGVVSSLGKGIAAASLGTTLILYFLRPEVPVEKDTAVTIVPAAGPDFAGATVVGTF